MKVKPKYPIKIDPVLVHKGTMGDTSGTDAEITAWFPGISYKEGSTQVAVTFDGIDRPCIVHIDQITKI